MQIVEAEILSMFSLDYVLLGVLLLRTISMAEDHTHLSIIVQFYCFFPPLWTPLLCFLDFKDLSEFFKYAEEKNAVLCIN